MAKLDLIIKPRYEVLEDLLTSGKCRVSLYFYKNQWDQTPASIRYLSVKPPNLLQRLIGVTFNNKIEKAKARLEMIHNATQ